MQRPAKRCSVQRLSPSPGQQKQVFDHLPKIHSGLWFQLQGGKTHVCSVVGHQREELRGEDLYAGRVPLSGWSLFILDLFSTLTAAVVRVIDYTKAWQTYCRSADAMLVNPWVKTTNIVVPHLDGFHSVLVPKIQWIIDYTCTEVWSLSRHYLMELYMRT